MQTIVVTECENGRPRVDVTIHRGDPVAVTVRWDPGKAGLTAGQVAAVEAMRDDLTGASWLAQIRTSPSAVSATAAFTKSETTEGEVLTVALALADSSALVADEVYVFDGQVTSGALAGQTLISGTITVEPDVSRPA